jgi:hypothetical protein
MAKVRAGIMACEGQRCESHDHNAPVVVFKNERETLSYSCDWCGRAPYARPGTGQHAEWTEAMQRNATAAVPTAADAPVPPAVEKKAAKASGTFF